MTVEIVELECIDTWRWIFGGR